MLKRIKKALGMRVHYQVLTLGLFGAGKSCIIDQIRFGKMGTAGPTMGYYPSEIEYNDHKMVLFDMPGRNDLRYFWKIYYKGTDAVIFVVDASDPGSMDEAAQSLFEVLANKKLKDAVLLVYANKVDTPPIRGKSVAEQVRDRLGLETNPLSRDRVWHVQECSALMGHGIREGFNWLCEELAHPTKKKKSKESK